MFKDTCGPQARRNLEAMMSVYEPDYINLGMWSSNFALPEDVSANYHAVSVECGAGDRLTLLIKTDYEIISKYYEDEKKVEGVFDDNNQGCMISNSRGTDRAYIILNVQHKDTKLTRTVAAFHFPHPTGAASGSSGHGIEDEANIYNMMGKLGEKIDNALSDSQLDEKELVILGDFNADISHHFAADGEKKLNNGTLRIVNRPEDCTDVKLSLVADEEMYLFIMNFIFFHTKFCT